WIMDPRSNIHIINNSKFTANEMLYAGAQLLPISEWGTVIILVRTLSGIQDIQLTSVALVEGFFANILSLSRCIDMQIHFNSRKNHLY
ncbi:hypothetical protein EK21DRAFT_82621, partial [Setomelanomma holmii]